MNIEVSKMRGSSAASTIFNFTENVCKLVTNAPSIVRFVLQLAAEKAPEIVHLCPYQNDTYIRFGETDLRAFQPIINMGMPGKYKLELKILNNGHLVYHMQLFLAFRNVKTSTFKE